MKVRFDFKDVKDIVSGKDEDVYYISLIFSDDEVMTYGYLDEDKYSKDYLEIISNPEREN